MELQSRLCILYNATSAQAKHDNSVRRKNDNSNLEDLRKLFLLEKKVNDRRKKNFNNNEIIDSYDCTYESKVVSIQIMNRQIF